VSFGLDAAVTAASKGNETVERARLSSAVGEFGCEVRDDIAAGTFPGGGVEGEEDAGVSFDFREEVEVEYEFG
jgi:hypothetical protein